MKKPVWRMNTGDGVPSDFGNLVALCDGHILKNCETFRDLEFHILKGKINIAAYQTTRTKAAKYRCVECDWCADERELTGIPTNNACRACKGSGSYREKI